MLMKLNFLVCESTMKDFFVIIAYYFTSNEANVQKKQNSLCFVRHQLLEKHQKLTHVCPCKQ